MIRAEVRFKNSTFMNALENSEYNSIAEFSRVTGVSYQSLISYASLRWLPKDVDTQVKIANLLKCDVYDLFEQYEDVVFQNKGNVRKLTADIPINKMLSFNSKELLKLESDYSTDNIDDKISIKKEVTDALETLKDREKDVIKMHFGIGRVNALAVSEIAERLGLTRERTRQIKEKALRRLRHRSRNRKLLPFAIISPKKAREIKRLLSEGKNCPDYSQKYSRELETQYKESKHKTEDNERSL